MDFVGHAECQCRGGYTGEPDCNEEINECLSGPCEHNSTCIDEINSFSCVCGEDWKGVTCSEPKDVCKVAGCHPNGTEACLHGNTTFECVCKASWEGDLCAEQVVPPSERTSCICPTFDDPLGRFFFSKF